jgi:hypothetical protein
VKIRAILLGIVLAAGLMITREVSYGADGPAPVSKNKSKKSDKTGRAVRPVARVYVDPVTGEVGTPPPDDNPARSQADPSSQRTAVIVNPDGSLTSVVPRGRMVFAVATTKADGGIAISEATAEGAEKLVKKPVGKAKNE